MHEAGGAAWLLAAAVCAFAGMGWLALAMPVHAQQAWGRVPQPAQRRVLRGLGAAALVLALACCLGSDHATMAVLVWAMLLAVAAASVAFMLAVRPRAVRWLAPWVRTALPRAADATAQAAARRAR